MRSRCACGNEFDTCEVDDLQADLEGEAPPLVLDVRSAKIYGMQHVSGTLNIPVDDIGECHDELPESGAHPIVTVCNRCNLSIRGMLVLQSLGYRNVRSLNGGTVAWA